MKCYIADTLIGIFAFDEAGNILNFYDFTDDDQMAVKFYELLENEVLVKDFEDLLSELKNSGFDEFIFDNKRLEFMTSQKLGYKTSLKNLSLEFKNFRFDLVNQLKKIGINKSRNDILTNYKNVNENLIKKRISQVGGQEDVKVIQISETLEILKKTISLFSMRLREWYGLHFPELTDKIIHEDVLLARMISTLGNRVNYTVENLRKDFDLGEQLLNLLPKKASESMGANFDLTMVKSHAVQILSLDSYRQALEDRLEELMEKTAPNLKSVVGALIGAKLIAKAGNLKKLAFMPASRIQLLGAEKALYRFLKTGDKRPKHGLIFQWNQIRGSPAYHRGKISRVVSGKIGLATKIDFFGGEFIGDVLAKEIEEKIEEIRSKYPKPPKKPIPKKEIPRAKSRKKGKNMRSKKR